MNSYNNKIQRYKYNVKDKKTKSHKLCSAQPGLFFVLRMTQINQVGIKHGIR